MKKREDSGEPSCCDEKTVSCREIGLTADVAKITFVVDASKETADNLKWLCWNAGLKYPEGISDLLNQMVADRLAKEGR